MSFFTRASSLLLSAPSWVVLAVAVAVVGVIGIRVRIAVIKARKAQAAPQPHAVLTWCVANGHAYQMHDTWWRCGACGNYVARREGEHYGPPEEGVIDRRREDRRAA
jgi:hypothetical protein